ncbi:MAG: lactate racemase domain-containing protein [Promethearchaeota archaeon]
MMYNARFGKGSLQFILPADVDAKILSPKGSSDFNDERFKDMGQDEVRRVITVELEKKREAIAGCRKILIISDDNTRVTPVKFIIPAILQFARGMNKEVEIIIASGSHRNMTPGEKIEKFGARICNDVTIHDHEWHNEKSFKNFGMMPGGYELKINKIACEPGVFKIGVGNIVPHSVAGFSGGYKILLPGLSCSETVRQVHFLISQHVSDEILGKVHNPIRDAINEVEKYCNLDLLINTVLDGKSRIISLCIGDPITTQYEGSRISRMIYGTTADCPADVVIADSVPEDIDFWVVAKAVTNTKSFVKKGGHLIILGPCREGLAPAHEKALLEIGYHPPPTIRQMFKDGKINEFNLLEASHACQVGEVLEHCNLHVVSSGLKGYGLEKYGFNIVDTSELQSLIDSVIAGEKGRSGGRKPVVYIVEHGSEILPVMDSRGDES